MGSESDKDEEHGGHKHDEGQGKPDHSAMLADFKRRFILSVIATVPVLALSPMIQSFLDISFSFPGDKWVLWATSSFVFFYGGGPFLKGLLDELKEKLPGMMTLIAVAITVAYVYSSLVVFGLRGKVFFWELVTLIDIMLLGHWIEMRSVMGASMAVEKLAHLMPTEAHLLKDDGSVEDIRVDEIEQGNKVRVKPGEKIPVDGNIIDGESEVDQSMITGESKPVSKSTDDKVTGGSVNGNGSLTIEVTQAGDDSYLAQVVRLVREASKSKSRAQDLANKAAFWLTVIAISVGTLTLIVWLLYGKEFVFALERMVTVMVITCPHALGLAVPLVIAVITSLSAGHGLLIRNRTAFENARRLDVVVFDKTGTLTKGDFGVSDIVTTGDWDRQKLLQKAASVEARSEHSIAEGIVGKAEEEDVKPAEVADFEAVPGKGAKAKVDGETVYVGNRGIAEKAGVHLEEHLERINEIVSQGKTLVLVIASGKLQAIIGMEDTVRDESAGAIKTLKELGLEIAMITGDDEKTAKHVAETLELDAYFAEVLPDKKSEKIKELQQQGKRVAMVGDGVNDAPALAQADVGIAIGAGTDVAFETADVVLVESNPANVADVVRLSRVTQRKMIQNLAWATGYNVVAIPLAAGVLYGYGFVLPPAVGALIMSVSTVIVAINAKMTSYE